ncbi:hypothetical protein PPL_00439 [Heterostelium album PN500]|uniref:Transmembrane protein n=1 Tax=Heterostelium pallidum (strain ATCC 26659 / Pp 5 / PN500) TaxID=670386 RepID=D3AWG5_HETP5|nr:hypothetical protein PPL_00439 [Heterostelium album PN500]EFA86638.1 hypothetical protein PPL_00439 [Heterostelium album PN500]|eukprot:XP_020438743.1 hypothetical protein PPL_00439 [Heterostelium album PN500]
MHSTTILTLFLVIFVTTTTSTHRIVYVDNRSTNSSTIAPCGSSPNVSEACPSLGSAIQSFLNTPNTIGQVTFNFTSQSPGLDTSIFMFTISTESEYPGPQSSFYINKINFINVFRVFYISNYIQTLNISVAYSSFDYTAFGGGLLSIVSSPILYNLDCTLDITNTTFNNITFIDEEKYGILVNTYIQISDSKLVTEIDNPNSTYSNLLQLLIGTLLMKNVYVITNIPLVQFNDTLFGSIELIDSSFVSVGDSLKLLHILAGSTNVTNCNFTNSNISFGNPLHRITNCLFEGSTFDNSQFYSEDANCNFSNPIFRNNNGTDIVCIDGWYDEDILIEFSNLDDTNLPTISNSGCTIKGFPPRKKRNLPAWAISIIVVGGVLLVVLSITSVGFSNKKVERVEHN